MKRKIGLLLMGLGVVLILAAALLLVYNLSENARAGEAAAEKLAEVQEVIDDNLQPPLADSAPSDTEAAAAEYDYLGYLSIPALELTLPVMSECSYDLLKIAPCRQFGTVDNDDLVIAGHNYKKHFGSLGSLEPDDLILFTVMNGDTLVYQVDTVTTVSAEASAEVQNSGYELVLYTCTYGGSKRILVGCTKIGLQEAAADEQTKQ